MILNKLMSGINWNLPTKLVQFTDKQKSSKQLKLTCLSMTSLDEFQYKQCFCILTCLSCL